MSTEPETIPISPAPAEKTRSEKLVHDLRSSVSTIQMAIGLLKRSRTNDEAFELGCTALKQELVVLKDLVAQVARTLEPHDNQPHADGA